MAACMLISISRMTPFYLYFYHSVAVTTHNFNFFFYSFFSVPLSSMFRIAFSSSLLFVILWSLVVCACVLDIDSLHCLRLGQLHSTVINCRYNKMLGYICNERPYISAKLNCARLMSASKSYRQDCSGKRRPSLIIRIKINR